MKAKIFMNTPVEKKLDLAYIMNHEGVYSPENKSIVIVTIASQTSNYFSSWVFYSHGAIIPLEVDGWINYKGSFTELNNTIKVSFV